ncbi:hypothetical protein FRC04_005454 [Tulasnella sp. 424]|nr:hypothetical protein FRC04_005454 [Tulasnella sp. 424]
MSLSPNSLNTFNLTLDTNNLILFFMLPIRCKHILFSVHSSFRKHSTKRPSFSLIFPLHLLYLTKTTGIPSSRYLAGLRLAVAQLLTNSPTVPSTLEYGKLCRLILGLTLGVTCPAVLWYISVVFAPISDVTALFNTNAFWAYVLSMIMASSGRSRIQWEWKKLVAVTTACGGVFAVVYGGARRSHSEARSITSTGAGSAILGDVLALAASMSYALYQVMYKRYAVLDMDGDAHRPLSPQSADIAAAYQPLLTEDPEEGTSSPPPEPTQGDDSQPHSVEPPFGFYPNFLTSMMGVTTLFVLWIPIPLMHWLGILLGVWGPIVVSVGNLLTIVLVLASNAVFGDGVETITIWSLLGCGMIAGAFSILAMDVLRN